MATPSTRTAEAVPAERVAELWQRLGRELEAAELLLADIDERGLLPDARGAEHVVRETSPRVAA